MVFGDKVEFTLYFPCNIVGKQTCIHTYTYKIVFSILIVKEGFTASLCHLFIRILFHPKK